MRLIVLLIVLSLMTACHSALERDMACLTTLMPEQWSALEEEEALRSQWRETHNAAYDARLADPSRNPWLAPVSYADAASQLDAGLIHETAARLAAAERREEEAYRKWKEVKERHADIHDWYGLVGRRVETRIEDQQIRSDLFAGLFPSTALLFYPLISWNLRTVLWDGGDPDSPTDPVTHFCAQRLGSIRGTSDSFAVDTSQISPALR